MVARFGHLDWREPVYITKGRAGTGGEEECGDLEVADICSKVQRRHIIIVTRVNMGTVLEE